jgi:hypothetical protein
MTLLSLIKYFRNPGIVGELYTAFGLELDAENVEIYMKETIDLNSEIHLVELAEYNGEPGIQHNGSTYVSFSSLYLSHSL